MKRNDHLENKKNKQKNLDIFLANFFLIFLLLDKNTPKKPSLFGLNSQIDLQFRSFLIRLAFVVPNSIRLAFAKS